MTETYRINKTVQSPELTSKWDGPVWSKAHPLQITHFMGTEPTHKPDTQAKLLYDDSAVYVIFRVQDNYVRATAKQYHDMVCNDSCVEFFFTPSDNISLGYFNVEINCGGVMLLYHQLGRDQNVVKVDYQDCDKIKIFHSAPALIEPECKTPMTWFVEYKLPFEVFEKYAPLTKPQKGVTWKGNFYKCADQSSHPHWLTWSVIEKPEPDFHRPEFFGQLNFV